MSEFLLYRTHIMTQRHIEKMEGMAVDIGYMTRYMFPFTPMLNLLTSCLSFSSNFN